MNENNRVNMIEEQRVVRGTTAMLGKNKRQQTAGLNARMNIITIIIIIGSQTKYFLGIQICPGITNSF